MLPPAPELVLDHERHAELRLHVLLQDARQQVGGAAGRERHHDRHLPLRPVLRLRRARCGEKAESRETRHQQSQLSTGRMDSLAVICQSVTPP